MAVHGERTRQDQGQEADFARAGAPAVAPCFAQVLRLQATAGNQAVARALAQSRRAVMREDSSDSESESGSERAVALAPEKEKEIREKARANQEPDPAKPPHTRQDVGLIKEFTAATTGKPAEEIGPVIDEADAAATENREELKAAPSPAADADSELPENEEDKADQEAEEDRDPVAVADGIVARGASSRDEERDAPLGAAPLAVEHAPTDLKGKAAASSSDEERDAPLRHATPAVEQAPTDLKGKASALDVDVASDAVEEGSAVVEDMFGVRPQPQDPTKLDLAVLHRWLAAARNELALVARQRPEPGLVKATAQESVATGDKVAGPSAELSGPGAVNLITAVTGPLTTEKAEGGRDLTAPGLVGTDAAVTGFTGTGDAAGGLARIVTGIERANQGIKNDNNAEIAGGLLDVLNGFGTIVKSGAGVAAKALGSGAPTALSAFGSILGVALGTVTAARYAVASDKAFQREAQVRALQHRYEGTARTARAAGGPTAQEDYEFYRVLRAAAFVMKHKSQRRGIKRLIGFTSAGGGVVSGILLTAGIFGLANIWNPIGWAIGGAATLTALGLSSYAIYRRIKRRSKREKLTARAFGSRKGEKASGPRIEVAPSQYADFIIREAMGCSHGNAPRHKQDAEQFLEQVLGIKRKTKLLGLAPEKAVKELSKKFGS